jgi:carbonic anhydrase
MDAHLVHQSPDHKFGVVAIQLDAGAENPMIKTLWNNLPKEKGKESAVPAVTINAKDLLPKNKGYYTFSGSFTTPPCSEEVTWFVLKAPVPISADQIARFASRYPMNARPVQPVNNRDIQGTR